MQSPNDVQVHNDSTKGGWRGEGERGGNQRRSVKSAVKLCSPSSEAKERPRVTRGCKVNNSDRLSRAVKVKLNQIQLSKTKP